MLQHVVLFKFQNSSSKEEIDTVVNSFKSLKDKISEIIAFEWGLNVSPENHHQGFTHCFTLSFQSLESLEHYQNNIHHLNFQKILMPHMEKVFVVDYYIQH